MNQESNIPKLRFPEFVGHQIKKYDFQDIFNFSIGKNIKQNEASPDFEIPCVRYGELYHLYSEVISEVVNKTNLDITELIFSNGDEILLPSAGEDPMDIGSASALTVKNVAIGRTINILRPRVESVYSQIFVSYYINKRLKKKISTLAKGVSISNVYNSDLKNLKIILPTLPEQQKIASFLTTVDTKIAQLSQKLTFLETYKKGAMQQLFSQQIRFKDENGNNYPDWKEKMLGEVAEKQSSNISANSIEENFGEYKIYGAAGILRHVDFYREEEQYISIVKDGAGVGRILLCDAYSSVLGTLDIIKPKIGAHLNFIFALLSNIDFTKYITGSTIPHIYFKDYSKEGIYLPCLEEQSPIANFLSAIDAKIDLVKTQLENTQAFKKGLLQQMFV